MDRETVFVCLAQEMAMLLHQLYVGNLSKLEEEQRNRCLIKTKLYCNICLPSPQVAGLEGKNVRNFLQRDLKPPISSFYCYCSSASKFRFPSLIPMFGTSIRTSLATAFLQDHGAG